MRKMSKNGDTKGIPPGQSWVYPRHVSARVDELLAELDEGQVAQLFHALATTTLADWFDWLEANRAAIGQYDALTASRRRARLRSRQAAEALRLQHACLYLEMWRCRVESTYMAMRGNPSLIERTAEQRALLIGVLAAYRNSPKWDLWPFVDHPEYGDQWPFQPLDANL